MVARLRARERGEFLAHDSFLPDEKEGVRSYNKRLMAVRSTPLSDRIDKLYNQMTAERVSQTIMETCFCL